jgi:SNF2 family DNA or RNA helicase
MKFKGKLKPYQLDGVRFALNNPYHINNFEMGLGKTIVALANAYKLGVKTLVVAPAFLRTNWKREIDQFTEGLDIEVISYKQLLKYGVFFKDPKTKKNVFECIKRDLPKYDLIIFDEFHYLKNKDALRSQVANAYLRSYKPRYMAGLTGTPVSNRVSEFWHLFELCHIGGDFPEFDSYHGLYFKFCNFFSYERSFEINGFPVVRFDGLRKNRIPELKSLVKSVLIRRRSKDVLDLKEAQEIDIIGDSSKYDKELYETLVESGADPNDPQYMSLKKSNALAKVETTIKLAKEFIEQDIRPLIWTCHVEAAKTIADKLNCRYITGEVEPEERQKIIDAFNTGLPSALVLTVGSGSTGFNITSTNYSIFNDIPFVPADLDQAKARTNRIGQEKACFYYYIFTSDFDQKLKDMITRKSNDIRRIYE